VMTLDEGGWRRPWVTIVSPPPALCGIVELFWIDEWSDAESSGRQFRVVADDAPHILWNFGRAGAHRMQRLMLVGSRARHHDIDLSGRHLLVGARLRPGALPLLTHRPAIQFTNRSVSLLDVVCPLVTRAIGRIETECPAEAVDRLATLIASLPSRRSAVDPGAVWIGALDRDHKTSVADVQHTLGIPGRTLRAWSLAQFGMGLKRLLRIRRLHAALDLWLSGAQTNWTRVAASAGYADQPHFIRECRGLLGQAPAAFVARAG